MHILIDVGHPAHIHFYAPIIKSLQQSGHSCLLCIRDKDCAREIAKSYNIPFVSKGSGSYFLLGKLFYFVQAIIRLNRIAKDTSPGIILSFASPYAAVISKWRNIPHIVFDDTETDAFVKAIYKRFSNQIITPKSFGEPLNNKHLFMDSFKELTYLNSTKQCRFRKQAHNKAYILVRLVKHGNMHDIFGKKWRRKDKFNFIRQLAKTYEVVISSEDNLPKDLKKFLNPKPIFEFHQLIANAQLVVGESATVAMEAAVLGVSAVYIDYNTRGYIKEVTQNINYLKHELPTKQGLQHSRNFIDNVMKGHFTAESGDYFQRKEDPVKFMVGVVNSCINNNQKVIG